MPDKRKAQPTPPDGFASHLDHWLYVHRKEAREVARRLKLSDATVSRYRSGIYKGVRDGRAARALRKYTGLEVL